MRCLVWNGRWTAPPGWWVASETTFVPKEPSDHHTGDANNNNNHGDDGYLLVFCTAAQRSVAGSAAPDPNAEVRAETQDGRASRLYVLDAAAMDDESTRGEVAAIELPGAVPYGLHSAWVPADELIE